MAQAKQFWPGLYQEAWGFMTLPWIKRDVEAPSAPFLSKTEVILFLGGILSVPRLYRRVAAEITRQTGIPVEFPWIGGEWTNMNWLAFERSVDLLRKEIELVHRRGKTVAGIVGYSLGGIQGSAVLEELEELKWLFMVASPIWGTPIKLLEYLATYRLEFDVSNPPPRFRNMRERLPSMAHRLVAISFPGDFFAPPSQCEIEGATNIICDEEAAHQWGHEYWEAVHLNCIEYPAIPRIAAAHFLEATDSPIRACAS